ncbi:G8 domain-containing protein [Salipiger sp. 1_MG-2023]|nr:G8 domain-containing protein [Salipiger sp. 1_MG-2023]
MMTEHAAQLDALAPVDEATHVAVKDGAWSDPSTWKNGQVPGAEAHVYIPSGITVDYDVDDTTPLATVRVAGMLDWATDQDTTMLVETIVTDMGSQIEIGSMHDTAVDADVTAQIIFRDTPIDTDTDPEMLSHGLVAMGHVDINGAAKESHLEISGNSVSRGSSSVDLDGDLTNWKVGDTILIVGTGDGSADETRTIVSVKGQTVTFDKPLNYDHEPPAGYDFTTYVGNLSRNVVFTSENPDGVRGHVMLMNDMVDHGENANSAMFAEFTDLGRTDESIPTGTSTNPTGRYPLHLHEIGTDPDSPSNMIQGVSVSGSPGWGIVQHSSDANIMDSIIYDTVGAGMVSEDGDETGMWTGNLVSSVASTYLSGHDAVGVEGSAYENQSRVIIQQDNIAANAAIGWNYFGIEEFPEDAANPSAPKDGIHRQMFEREQLPYDPSPFDVALDHEEPPIVDFNNNTSIATGEGLRVFHRQFSDDTDTMSVFREFTVWGGSKAVSLDNYASNYMFIDSVWQGSDVGFSIMRKTSSVVFNNVEVSDFDTGYQSWGLNHEVVLIDTDFVNVGLDIDQDDLMRNVSSSALESYLIDYYKTLHGIDYTNALPQILDSSSLTPIEAITFTPDAGSDMTIGKNDLTLNFTGTITDSVGVRNFNEYVVAKTPSGQGTSKDFEGIDLLLGASSGGLLREFTLEMFLDLHGVIQKDDGTWVSPVVNWITDRLTGDQHPVIIEIEVVNMTEAELSPYMLDSYPTPTINNPEWYTTNGKTTPSTDDDSDTDTDDHGTGTEMPDAETDSDSGETTTDEDTKGDVVDNTPDAPQASVPDDTAEDDEDEDATDSTPDDDSAAGATGGDTTGSSDDTVILGTSARDTLIGTAGSDILDGGYLTDTLTGGKGADSFRFTADSLDGYRDWITDFSSAEGDLIDMSGIADAMGLDEAAMLEAVSVKNIKPGLRVGIELDGEFHALAALEGVKEADFSIQDSMILTSGDAAEAQPDTSAEETQSQPDVPVETDTDAGTETEAEAEEAASETSETVEQDVMLGTEGRDTLVGTDGDDFIDGYLHVDTLTGGMGADTFIFTADTLDGYRDTVTDFSQAEGDQIDLSGIAEVLGFNEAEMMDAVSFKDIKPGLRVGIDVDGTFHALAVLNDVEQSDFMVDQSVIFTESDSMLA